MRGTPKGNGCAPGGGQLCSIVSAAACQPSSRIRLEYFDVVTMQYKQVERLVNGSLTEQWISWFGPDNAEPVLARWTNPTGGLEGLNLDGEAVGPPWYSKNQFRVRPAAPLACGSSALEKVCIRRRLQPSPVEGWPRLCLWVRYECNPRSRGPQSTP